MSSAGVNRVCLKGHSKHFQLQVIGPCGNYSDLPLQCTSSHRGYGKKWVKLCSSNSLFTKVGVGLLQ